MKNLILILLLLIFWSNTQAQSIANVKARQEGNSIIVSYDLNGAANQTYQISLYSSADNYQTACKTVSGNIGTSESTGKNKFIFWDVLKDRTALKGNLSFEILATLNEQPKTQDLLPFEPEMVEVQGGTFDMGCTSEQQDCESDEKPVHSVTVSSFQMGKYEVTQKQWRDIMGSDPPELTFKGCDDCPVERVSWNDVQEYIKKLNAKTGKIYRLPTEAEWEFAARGGNNSQKNQFSGGSDPNSVAWNRSNSGSKTHPVGKKSKNELGIYDMSGNVWEWCEDWYDEKFYEKSAGANNPVNKTVGANRVFRGGSWDNGAVYLRVAFRYHYTPTLRHNGLGFRLVIGH